MRKVLFIFILVWLCRWEIAQAYAGIGSRWELAAIGMPLLDANLAWPAIIRDGTRDSGEEVAAMNRSPASTQAILTSTATIHGLSASGRSIPGGDTDRAHYG